jgi:ATP-dependent protease Clp ATPase subunit
MQSACGFALHLPLLHQTGRLDSERSLSMMADIQKSTLRVIGVTGSGKTD